MVSSHGDGRNISQSEALMGEMAAKDEMLSFALLPMRIPFQSFDTSR
jgi:hypothetical protein